MKALDTELRKWMKKNKLTIDGFARGSGVSYYTIQKLITVRGRNPSRATVKKISLNFPDCPLVKYQQRNSFDEFE